MKTKKIIKPIAGLAIGGVGLGLGASMLDAMPSSSVTSSVGAGFTKFAGFYPMLATGAVMGIATNQLMDLNKKFKRRK